jgi:transcriptional regulator with XRE-family HTH domain
VSTGSEPIGPSVVRRRLGVELRRLREEANLRLEEVARELEVSPSKISRIETGHSIAKTWDVRNLLTVYGLEADIEKRDQFLRWAEESKAVAWWHPFSDASPIDLDHYMSLEAEAAIVDQFCTPSIPGLLQTRKYAESSLGGMLDYLGPRELKGLVDIRIRRQEALARKRLPLRYNAILDEAALMRPVGDDKTMSSQFAQIVDWIEKRRVVLRVRKFAAPARRFAMSSFTIFSPRLTGIDPRIVNVEAAGYDHYYEEEEHVSEFVSAFQVLWNDSIPESETLELIRGLIR